MGGGRQEARDRRRETGDGRGFYDVKCCGAGPILVFSNTGTGFGSTLEKTIVILNDILVVHSITD